MNLEYVRARGDRRREGGPIEAARADPGPREELGDTRPGIRIVAQAVTGADAESRTQLLRPEPTAARRRR